MRFITRRKVPATDPTLATTPVHVYNPGHVGLDLRREKELDFIVDIATRKIGRREETPLVCDCSVDADGWQTNFADVVVLYLIAVAGKGYVVLEGKARTRFRFRGKIFW